MTSDYDWSRFSYRIMVDTSAEEIYCLWATREGMEYWFLRKSAYFSPDGAEKPRHEPVQVNDTYEWMWHGYPDEVVERGKILEANGKDLFRFTFAGDCIVTVRIIPEKGQHVVELTQENIPTDEKSKVDYHLGCSTGWTFYFANLKSLLEGGIDLRNKDVSVKNVVNA